MNEEEIIKTYLEYPFNYDGIDPDVLFKQALIASLKLINDNLEEIMSAISYL